MLPVVTALLPGELLSAGLTSVLFAGGELDADEGGVDGLVVLPDADADVATLGLAVLVGVGLAVAQRVSVGLAAFLLPGALTFAVAEADVLALLLALAVAVAEAVPLLPLPPGLALALLLAGLPLVLPLAGLVTELCGRTLGGCGELDPLPLAAGLGLAGDEVADGHAVAFSPLGLADVAPRPDAPFDEPAALPDPARLGTPALELEEDNPTADPS